MMLGVISTSQGLGIRAPKFAASPGTRRRYERASTLLTSNRPVEDWGKLLGDAAAVSAMLDRLLHHGHVLKCGPRSWRTKLDAPEREAGRRFDLNLSWRSQLPRAVVSDESTCFWQLGLAHFGGLIWPTPRDVKV